MHDPTPEQDELEPLYNPITQDNESPADILDIGFPEDDVDPLYNPVTMEFAEEDEENE